MCVGCAAATLWFVAVVSAVIANRLVWAWLPLFMCVLAAAVTLSLVWAYCRLGVIVVYFLGRERGKRLAETSHGSGRIAPLRVASCVLTRQQLIAATVALFVAVGASVVFAARATSNPAPGNQAPIALPPAVAYDSLTGQRPPAEPAVDEGVAEDVVASSRRRPAKRTVKRGRVLDLRLPLSVVRPAGSRQRTISMRPDRAGNLIKPVTGLLD